jgi:PAS domain S-box-containing protein
MIPAPAAVLDENGVVVAANEEAIQLLGWTGGPPEQFPGYDAPWFFGLWSEVRGEGRGSVLIRRTVAGRRLAVELRCQALDDGSMLVLFSDCTSQVMTRRSQRSREQHLRAFLERIPEPVFVEQDGVVAFANAAAEALHQREGGSVAGRRTEEFLPAGLLRRVREEAGLRPDAVAQQESQVEDNVGRRMLRVCGLPVTHGGRPALALVVRDMTEQRQAEHGLVASRENLRRSEEQLRQAQKMDAIGRLAAGIAHDFNNLLTAIQGHVQFVLEELPPASAATDDVLEIRRVADRATELTRQLLTFARRQPSQPQPTDLNGVVRDVERLLRRLVRADIALELELADSVPAAMVDRGQLEQVLVNLVVNARDAIREGGRISIRTALVELDTAYREHGFDLSPGAYVQLAISDTGCGMSSEVQNKMFEPFYTTKSEGTGLGLPTVYGIVRQAGGHISVYSEEGMGTTMKVFIPVAPETVTADDGTVSGTAAFHAADGPLFPEVATATVLLVEDDASIRNLAERTLRNGGMAVLAAASGEEALRLADTAPDIDVVVTDLMMPNMSGDQLAARIAGSSPCRAHCTHVGVLRGKPAA